MIEYRERYPLDMAHNARRDDSTSHRRSIVEAMAFVLKQRYDDTLRAQWFWQFRDPILKRLYELSNRAIYFN